MAKAQKHKIEFKLPKSVLKYFALVVPALIFIAYIIGTTKFTFSDLGLLIAFILIGAFSRFHEKFLRISLGIELISIFTIITAIKYGSLTGAVVGSAAFIISGYLTIDSPQDVLIAVAGFIGVAFFAPLAYAFVGQSLGITAIVLTVGYDIFTGFFYFFMGHGWFGVLRFTVVHIIANYFIISYFGAKLLGI